MARVAAVVVAAVLLCAAVQAKVFLHEEFNSLDAWVQSEAKADLGKAVLSSGDFFGDKAINQGLKTSQDAHFYAIARELPLPHRHDPGQLRRVHGGAHAHPRRVPLVDLRALLGRGADAELQQPTVPDRRGRPAIGERRHLEQPDDLAPAPGSCSRGRLANPA